MLTQFGHNANTRAQRGEREVEVIFPEFQSPVGLQAPPPPHPSRLPGNHHSHRTASLGDSEGLSCKGAFTCPAEFWRVEPGLKPECVGEEEGLEGRRREEANTGQGWNLEVLGAGEAK